MNRDSKPGSSEDEIQRPPEETDKEDLHARDPIESTLRTRVAGLILDLDAPRPCLYCAPPGVVNLLRLEEANSPIPPTRTWFTSNGGVILVFKCPEAGLEFKSPKQIGEGAFILKSEREAFLFAEYWESRQSV